MPEVLAVFAVVTLLCFAITRLRAVAALSEYVSLGVGAVFLLAALEMAKREARRIEASFLGVLERWGIALGGLLAPAEDRDENPGPLGLYDLARLIRRGLPSALRESGVALGIALLIFPPFAFAFAWWHNAHGLPGFRPSAEAASFILAQFLVVALPEEVFFRGYVQTRLVDHFGPPPKSWMIVHPSALLLQSALFALVHVAVDPNPARLAVFFPGLLFGLIRGWRGGVGAAIVLHALSNIYSDLLVRGWLSG